MNTTITLPKVTAEPFTDEFFDQSDIFDEELKNIIASYGTIQFQANHLFLIVVPSTKKSGYIQITTFDKNMIPLSDYQAENKKEIFNYLNSYADVLQVLEVA